MANLLRTIFLGVLLLSAAALPAAAQGRGDHDTPATQRRSEGREETYYNRACRNDDGWVVCRDNNGRWRRMEREARWPWEDEFWDNDDDWYRGRSRMIDGNDAARVMKRSGFEDLRDMKLRGDVYSAKAVDRYGRPVIVSVDPYTGEIVDVIRR
jgi:hypothetical protein